MAMVGRVGAGMEVVNGMKPKGLETCREMMEHFPSER